jgi:hypothetical protein
MTEAITKTMHKGVQRCHGDGERRQLRARAGKSEALHLFANIQDDLFGESHVQTKKCPRNTPDASSPVPLQAATRFGSSVPYKLPSAPPTPVPHSMYCDTRVGCIATASLHCDMYRMRCDTQLRTHCTAMHCDVYRMHRDTL